jgi:crossover junction endodeoxyribonuclease RuvC
MVTGYGIVDKAERGLHCVFYQEIKPARGAGLSVSLLTVYNGITEAINQFHPEIMAIEDIFYGKNVQSLIKQGHVRGVAVLAAAQAGMEIYEYSPLEIKKAVSGYGFADKRQVQVMVKNILKLAELPPSDAADALAAAICHIHFLKTEQV